MDTSSRAVEDIIWHKARMRPNIGMDTVYVAHGRFQFSPVPWSCWSGGVSWVVALPVTCAWDDVADSGRAGLLVASSRSTLPFCIRAA
jgi:hypothetical protein